MQPRVTPSDLVRSYFAAWEAKDQKAIEEFLADDFRFSSPFDDHIDRATYLLKVWPRSEGVRAVHIQKLFEDADEAFVLYMFELKAGPSVRNTGLFRTAGGKVKEVEVYFGSLPGTQARP